LVATGERRPGGKEFARASKVAGRVDGEVEQRRLIDANVYQFATCVEGVSFDRVMPDSLYELCELNVGVGMVGGAGGRTQAIKPNLARCRPT
jgi:hypothetical protein